MLIDQPFRFFQWDWTPEMVRIRTPGDGHCLLHSILGAFHQPYIEGKITDKTAYVRKLRHTLSLKLPEVYESLSDGYLSRLGNTEEGKALGYDLKSMQRLLDSSEALDHRFNEFFSDVFDLDIYLMSHDQEDLYLTGDIYKFLHKGRSSVIILVLPGHYETVGMIRDRGIQTLFHPRSTIITSIKNRMKQITDDKS